MGFYNILWILLKYVIPIAILIYSIVKFNPFFIMVGILWLLATLVVSLINFSIKSNFVKG
jgi:hypothetical protein